MIAVTHPSSSSIKNGLAPELETTSSWKGRFETIWKTHRMSLLIGSGLALSAVFSTALYASSSPVPINPGAIIPFSAKTNPDVSNGFCEYRSAEAFPDRSSIPIPLLTSQLPAQQELPSFKDESNELSDRSPQGAYSLFPKRERSFLQENICPEAPFVATSSPAPDDSILGNPAFLFFNQDSNSTLQGGVPDNVAEISFHSEFSKIDNESIDYANQSSAHQNLVSGVDQTIPLPTSELPAQQELPSLRGDSNELSDRSPQGAYNLFPKRELSFLQENICPAASFVATSSPAPDNSILGNPAFLFFNQESNSMLQSCVSDKVAEISFHSELSTIDNESIVYGNQSSAHQDLVNRVDQSMPLLPEVAADESSSFLSETFKSATQLACDRLTGVGSYIKNGMQDGLDELSFNLFSGRVAFDISLLAIAAAYSRNLVLLPQDQAALTIITVKTLRDIFIPPLPASFASSVLKCSALAIALYLA